MRVVIAEDDRAQARRLGAALEEDSCEVFFADDGSMALSLLRDVLPDAIILDMVMPIFDGAAVLDSLPTLSLEKKPLIAALVPARAKHFQARTRRAALVLEKPYDPEKVVQFLRKPPAQSLSPSMRESIETLLLSLGARPYTKGFLYLTEAIGMAAADFSLPERIGSGVYTPIARKYGVRASNVERLIRHAIESATVRGRLTAYHQFFGYTLRRDTGKPTNAEFIAILAENARRMEYDCRLSDDSRSSVWE